MKILYRHLQQIVLLLATSVLAASGCTPPLDIRIPPTRQDFACTNPYQTIPDDPTARGPWPVGARTVAIPNARWGSLKTEIWYPAVRGSEAGQKKKSIDLREFLPYAYSALIPDEAGANQVSDCYDTLPIDIDNGPYPVIVFMHGLASFRTQSSVQTTHWASRGFVVVSADHPNLQLRDLLERRIFRLPPSQSQDAVDIIAALQEPAGELAFLAGAIDMERVAVSGHSAGASSAARLGDVPGVRVAVLMSSGGADAGTYLKSVLILGAENDRVVPYENQQSGYVATNTVFKRLIGIANAGHMAFTEICTLLEDDGGLLEVAMRYGVPVPEFLIDFATDGCDSSQTQPEAGWELINGVSSAVFEETLQCRPERNYFFENIQERYDIVLEYQEQSTE